MTTDTTPGVDHERAIREIVRRCPLDTDNQRGGWDWMLTDADVREILDHADALEAARRDAEARAKRLNDALLIVAAIADERGKRLSPYSPDTLSEDAQSEMGLHPGDVRRMAGPQRGREQA